MTAPTKIIDLFSGPGGLGEGFSAVKDSSGQPTFKIAVSIEKEASAHATLKLRAFFRQFGDNVPSEYYDFLKGKLGKRPEEQLYPIFEKEHAAAEEEALCLTLGENNKEIYSNIRKSIGPDECILVGGPPCQAYSLAGRSRNMGIKNYDAQKDHRNFLYLEYLKVIAKFQPMIFVMENVKGMLSAKINGTPIFDGIYRDLKNPCKATNTKPEGIREKHTYKLFSLVTENSDVDNEDRDPRDFTIYSEKYNIPQKRHRVIILGVREDLAYKWKDSMLLEKGAKELTVSNALSGLPKLRSGLSKVKNASEEEWVNAVKSIRDNVIPALKKSTDQSHRIVAKEITESLRSIGHFEENQGKNWGLKAKPAKTGNSQLNNWYADKKLNGYITNNETRGHIVTDLHRYIFCSSWAKCATKNNWDIKTPKSKDYIKELAPNHANFTTGKFADRFRVQVENKAATTITSHISKDGHYYIHPDPTQCRSLTVREAARIQTFPDNYFFVGNRTQQYVQVGNAVPPYLSNQIAQSVTWLLKS